MSRVLGSAGTRWLVVAVVLVVFAAVGAILVFGNQGPTPQQRLFQVNVTGKTMSPSALQANDGDTLTVSVATDKYEEIHLHGYDKHFFSSPGQPATLTFRADKTGSFVIEIEATGAQLGLLQVQPRAGLFGIGKPADQSSTTIHAPAGGTLIQLGSSANYNYAVEIGGIQPMYTPAQVASQHPKTGEVMYKGQMVMPPGMDPSQMSMGNMAGMNIPLEWRHLEVHIFNKKSGDVVNDAPPVITVTNRSTGKAQTVPIVTMQGIVEGPSDFHYGNNIDLPAGRYLVTVTVNTDIASFDFNV